MFERTRKYRTAHSINDSEVEFILKALGEGVDTFVDLGCHLGHLGFEVAMLPKTRMVLAVDNFKGTRGEDLMAKTVREITSGTGDFLWQYLRGLKEVWPHLKAPVVPVNERDFWQTAPLHPWLQGVFVDTSHLPEDDWQLVNVAVMMAPGGIMMGHDCYEQCPNIEATVAKLERSGMFKRMANFGSIFHLVRKPE